MGHGQGFPGAFALTRSGLNFDRQNSGQIAEIGWSDRGSLTGSFGKAD